MKIIDSVFATASSPTGRFVFLKCLLSLQTKLSYLTSTDYTYIPYQTLRRSTGVRGRFALGDFNTIIAHKTFSVKKHVCRSFKIIDSTFVSDFVKAGIEDNKAALEAGNKVDLVDAFERYEFVKKRKSKPRILNDSVLKYSKQIVHTSDIDNSLVFTNKKYSEAHLRKMGGFQYAQSDMNSLLHSLCNLILNKTPFDKTPSSTMLASDVYLLNIMMSNATCIDSEAGVYAFNPEYELKWTGRSYELGGGFQILSNFTKQLLLSVSKNTYNYDISKSQLNLLKQVLEESSLSTASVDFLLNTKDLGLVESELSNLESIAMYKTYMYALIFGSDVASSDEQLVLMYNGNIKGYGTVDAVKTHFNEAWCINHPHKSDKERIASFITLYKKLTMYFGGLFSTIKVWHKHLDSVWLCDNTKKSRKNELYIQNDMGMSLYLNMGRLENSTLCSKKIAAFILQGREARFIYEIVMLSKKFGYTVVSNQHDGVITIGEIPDEAISMAKTITGYSGIQLIEKPFCTDNLIEPLVDVIISGEVTTQVTTEDIMEIDMKIKNKGKVSNLPKKGQAAVVESAALTKSLHYLFGKDSLCHPTYTEFKLLEKEFIESEVTYNQLSSYFIKYVFKTANALKAYEKKLIDNGFMVDGVAPSLKGLRWLLDLPEEERPQSELSKLQLAFVEECISMSEGFQCYNDSDDCDTEIDDFWISDDSFSRLENQLYMALACMGC